MYTRDDLVRDIEKTKKKFMGFADVLQASDNTRRMKEIQESMSDPAFWNNQQESKKLIDELKDLKEKTEAYTSLKENIEELTEYMALADTESMVQQLHGETVALAAKVDALELKLFLADKFDRNNAIVDINSGAGGTEACDWAQMISRMYERWAEEKKFTVETVDTVRGDEAGIKSSTFIIKGNYAYGYLKGERGVHRLVRISPFDSNKRRHTSFASVDIIPEIEEDTVEFVLNPSDLKIETFRASGAGGQHVNKTDSAVRITHIPTGFVTQSQSERSQFQNKQVALSVMRSRLYERLEQEKKKELESLSGDKKRIEWGSQIRSYVLHPYLMVKDHRTKEERTDALMVLEGKIDSFIHSWLRESKKSESGKKTPQGEMNV